MEGIFLNCLQYVMLFAAAVFILRSDKDFDKYLKPKYEKWLVLFIIALGFILRLLLAVTTKGHSTDIACFQYWANRAGEVGLVNFYDPKIFADYPPGYVYVLYVIGKMRQILALDIRSTGFLLLVKLPAIIADCITAYLLSSKGSKYIGRTVSLVLCILYLFNPAVILNSAIWGQIDGVFTLFILLSIISTAEGTIVRGCIYYTIALLIKPQALIFTPVLLFSLIQKRDFRIWCKSALYSIVLFITVVLPFTIKQQPLWIIDKYKSTLQSYPYATVNAFNLFALSGGNWVSDNKNFILLSYKTWGTIFIILIVLFSTLIYFKSKEKARLFYIAFFIISSVFVLSSKMHERYIFPVLALSLLWYIYSMDKRALYTFLGFTVTHYINTAYVLQLNYNEVNQVAVADPVLKFTSLANLLLLLYVVKLGMDLYWHGKKTEILSKEKDNIDKKMTEQSIYRDYEKETSYRKKDFILLGALIIIYTIVAFYKLGSLRTPESYWQSQKSEEYSTADFGEAKEINKLYYYGGTLDGSYSVEFSEDGSTWTNKTDFTIKAVFEWENVDVNAKARYAKVVSNASGQMLSEVGFFARNVEIPVKIKEVKGDSDKAFDEQDRVKYRPSFMDGTYFDEIYHARTAFEYIKGLEPYEWTHPPLGKLLIAVGVLALGMNPFGWRIVGTVFGIAMLPMMYLLGKKLFYKGEYAFLTAFLMAFDFMHFTQTRIATVDVYVVFFTISTYYFMYKYIRLGIEKDGFRKLLLMLALSGSFFGLGTATKWSCIYGGLGLAVIFFADFIKRHRNFKGKLLKLILWCCLFFIIIPAIIYLLSYIPFMNIPGDGHGIKDVISYQKRMYDYHSKLVATHPFSSPWWQWPFMIRPIWYYSGQQYLSGNKISSIVAMGNPAIWWIGAVSFIATAVVGIKEKDNRAFFIIVAGLSQYLPWVLVPRLTFIYHYFPFVPFMILSIVYMIQYFRRTKSLPKWSVYTYMFVVVILFIMFYPVISGAVADKTYVEKFLRWFESWIFYS